MANGESGVLCKVSIIEENIIEPNNKLKHMVTTLIMMRDKVYNEWLNHVAEKKALS